MQDNAKNKKRCQRCCALVIVVYIALVVDYRHLLHELLCLSRSRRTSPNNLPLPLATNAIQFIQGGGASVSSSADSSLSSDAVMMGRGRRSLTVLAKAESASILVTSMIKAESASSLPWLVKGKRLAGCSSSAAISLMKAEIISILAASNNVNATVKLIGRQRRSTRNSNLALSTSKFNSSPNRSRIFVSYTYFQCKHAKQFYKVSTHE
jgi:hypothetical protein